MSIPPSQINTDWIPIPAAATVRQVRDAIPPDKRRITWIVTPMGDGSYAVFRMGSLINFLQGKANGGPVQRWMLRSSLADLGTFLPMYTRKAVDVSADLDVVKETWNPLADPPLVVLQNGNPIGVLKSTARGGEGDIHWLDNEPKSANGGGPKAVPPPPPIPVTGGGGTGGAESTGGGPSPAAPTGGVLGVEGAPAPPAAPTRFINAVLEGHDQNAPLQVGEGYVLAFSVDLQQLAAAQGIAVFKDQGLFPTGMDQVDLLVQLLSDDVEINTEPQKLTVPRVGKSKNKARFDISPKHNGECLVTVVFTKDGNAIQAMNLRLNVGASGQSVLAAENLGRSVEVAGTVKPRDLTLWIENTGANFRLNVLDKGAQSATLPLTTPDLENAVVAAREVLKQIVNWNENGDFVYQSRIDIDPAVNAKTLPLLAKAGYLLFQEIFMHVGADQQARAFANYLRQRAQDETLKIQIASKELMLPWGILYMADTLDLNNIQPELFLGLKHIIETIPFQADMNYPDNISSQPQLTVSLNLNQDIDKPGRFTPIADQQAYWNSIQTKNGVKVITRTNGDDVVKALASTATSDQILYFYCHAISKGFAEGGADASFLQFGGPQNVTLGDLKAFASSNTRLPGSPLVFINACESAELSPLFYNGFMPYFVDKGARGVIGTECPVPALLAADWMKEFFNRFLAGKPIGQIFYELRREYFYNRHNILGLLYAVYCDADTTIAPGFVM